MGNCAACWRFVATLNMHKQEHSVCLHKRTLEIRRVAGLSSHRSRGACYALHATLPVNLTAHLQAKDFDKLWDTVTQRLVDVSAVAFIFLLLPQLIKNAKLIAAGNGAALSGLAWEVRR